MPRAHARRRIPVVAAVGAAVALALAIPAALAAPPANDAFAAAQPIAGESGSVTGTTVEATKEPGEPAHAEDPGGRSVWYRWVAPTSGQFVFDTCGSGFDTLLAVYTGPSVSALTELASNDDSCEEQSLVVITVSAGTAYSIAVDVFRDETAAPGTFTLRWRAVRPPANDAFATAQRLEGPRGTADGSNVGAGPETGERSVAGSVGASVWFVWTAPSSGTAAFETCGSSFDTVLIAYTGEALGSLTVVAANDDRCRLQSRIRFAVRAGTTYRIAVDGAEDDSTGFFRLMWSLVARPANDTVAGARRIAGARGSLQGSNEGALAERGEPPHAGFPASASVWFRWRAPRTMGIRFDTCASTFDTVLSVYRGRTPRASALVAANDDACRRVGSRVNFIARRGVDYLIAVDGVFDASGRVVLAWGRPGADARCRVPDVRGRSLAQARIAIERAGCRVGRVVYSRSALVGRGRVISQQPPPGRRLRFLGRIHLEVSR